MTSLLGLARIALFRRSTVCLARQSRSQSSKPYFTTEAWSSQSSEYFLIKNSLLGALRASAVSSLLDRYNQNENLRELQKLSSIVVQNIPRSHKFCQVNG